VLLKSFFDGGNEVDWAEPDRIVKMTLATVCGLNEQWRAFDPYWKKVLHDHRAPPLHTTDAVSLKRDFSEKKGWTGERVDALILDCVRLIAKHIAIPMEWPGMAPRQGIFVTTLSIKPDDYRKARATLSMLPNSIADVLASESVGFCFKWGTHIGTHWWQFYFDQGEPFYGHVRDRLNNKESKKAIPLMSKVSHLGESNTRESPALQVADLFAWCINHNDNVVRDWHRALHSLPWRSLFLDHDLLVKPKDGALERMESWNLPKRRPT
jgi:hypothetical protein